MKRIMMIENMSHCSMTCIIPKDWTKHVHFVYNQHVFRYWRLEGQVL